MIKEGKVCASYMKMAWTECW